LAFYRRPEVSGRVDRGIRHHPEMVPGGIAIADDAVMGVHITRPVA
jgi:hypothetical protein